MKIVCISDTHNSHRDIDVPDGDILIHAGDCSFRGEWSLYKDLDAWFGELPHKYKVIIAGNHDFNFYDYPWKNGTPLLDQEIVIDGLRIHGSPYSPTFGNWAWMKDRGHEIMNHWAMIDEGVDVLIVHGPPHMIGDQTVPRWGAGNVGCEDLARELERIKPRLGVFGHIHNGYGRYEKDGMILVNASSCNEDYDPVNKPIIVELP